MEAGQGGRWIPLQEAAPQLGIPLDTLRKKAQRGTIIARKVPRPQGHSWELYLDGELAAVQDTRTPASSDLAGPMERLIEENHRLAEQNVQLAGQVGYLQAKLQAAEERILLLEAPQQSSVASEAEPHAPWWRFWAR